MRIDINWNECNSAESQVRTQRAISALEQMYGGLPGWIDMHPVGEYCIVHKQFGIATHSFEELYRQWNV